MVECIWVIYADTKDIQILSIEIPFALVVAVQPAWKKAINWSFQVLT